MDDNQARALLENLLDRISSDARLQQLITHREADAIRRILEEEASEPRHSSSKLTQASPAGPQTAPEHAAYEGNVHLCLDFGTAMSKAFAWDRERDRPLLLEIGRVAGEAGSPFTLQSALFVTHDGIVHFGQAAFNAASAANPNTHRSFRSIKDLLTVGQLEALSQPLDQEFNPTEIALTNRDAIALYLAFLTDVALRALEEAGESNVRRIPRSYTKPVFDESRDRWATDLLSECATIGQLLADEFSGRWTEGIPIGDIRVALDRFSPMTSELRQELILESGVLPEPVAAFVSRCWHYEPTDRVRRVFMVIDVGAGTTDFAMFAQVEENGKMTVAPISGSVSSVRYAGDMIDNLLLQHLLRIGGVNSDHPQYSFLAADLHREIRLIKENLFVEKKMSRSLVNDVPVSTDWDSFQASDEMQKLSAEMKNKFMAVLENVHSSWLSLGDLPVFFSGGGAGLPTVTNLANGQPLQVGESWVTPRAVQRFPKWLEDADDSVGAIRLDYQQLAVCIGGACSGAGSTPHVELERYLKFFGGSIPKANWSVEVVRKGQ